MKVNQQIKKSVGLVRVSTIGQSEENGGTSISFQSDKIIQYSKLNNFKLVKTIIDIASGGLDTRDGIEKLKLDVKNGLVDVVLIWNCSRAFRSMVAFTKFYEFLKNHNVELISVSENIRSSTNTGKMMFGILSSIAEMEKDIITERLSSGRNSLVQRGQRGFGGKLPFGYSKNSEGKIVADKNSKIVKYIFSKMNQLNKRNLTKTKKTQLLLKLIRRNNFTYFGKDFKNYHLKTILNNSFYIGDLTYGNIKTSHNYDTLISKRLYNQVVR